MTLLVTVQLKLVTGLAAAWSRRLKHYHTTAVSDTDPFIDEVSITIEVIWMRTRMGILSYTKCQ
jgi:hypothetical protein